MAGVTARLCLEDSMKKKIYAAIIKLADWLYKVAGVKPWD
jgi:hypothetical protein